MQQLTHKPVLGHITTFGGHPVSCAAGKAALEVLLTRKLHCRCKRERTAVAATPATSRYRAIVNTAGLWASLAFDSFEINLAVIHRCIANGLITDWFLFAANRLRIAPPLTITMQELNNCCDLILQSITEALPSINQPSFSGI